MFLVSYSINFQSFNNVEEYGKLQMNMLFLNSGKKVSDYNDIDSFVKDYYSIVTKSIPSSMSEEDFAFELKNILKQF